MELKCKPMTFQLLVFFFEEMRCKMFFFNNLCYCVTVLPIVTTIYLSRVCPERKKQSYLYAYILPYLLCFFQRVINDQYLLGQSQLFFLLTAAHSQHSFVHLHTRRQSFAHIISLSIFVKFCSQSALVRVINSYCWIQPEQYFHSFIQYFCNGRA